MRHLYSGPLLRCTPRLSLRLHKMDSVKTQHLQFQMSSQVREFSHRQSSSDKSVFDSSMDWLLQKKLFRYFFKYILTSHFLIGGTGIIGKSSTSVIGLTVSELTSFFAPPFSMDCRKIRDPTSVPPVDSKTHSSTEELQFHCHFIKINRWNHLLSNHFAKIHNNRNVSYRSNR